MKQIKVLTGHRGDIQEMIDKWLEETPDIEIMDLKGGGPSEHGYVICYIIYHKEVKL